jgi:hypothetical protein
LRTGAPAAALGRVGLGVAALPIARMFVRLAVK